MTWPTARAEKLERLWNQGFSAGQIAARMGISRAAVKSKISSLGLTREDRYAPAGDKRVKQKPHDPLSPEKCVEMNAAFAEAMNLELGNRGRAT